MKKGWIFLFLILISQQNFIFAQKIEAKDLFQFEVRNVNGDLNNDGKPDQITVKMDTISPTRPLKLEIFLSQPNGQLKRAVSSTQIIEAQYPAEKNGDHNGFQIPDFFIENGNLIMLQEIEKGNITYNFNYQKGNFELINVRKLTNNSTQGFVDEHTIFTEMNFDLTTGLRTETDNLLSASKKFKIRKKTILMRPLPKIQNFKFSDKKLF